MYSLTHNEVQVALQRRHKLFQVTDVQIIKTDRDGGVVAYFLLMDPASANASRYAVAHVRTNGGVTWEHNIPNQE